MKYGVYDPRDNCWIGDDNGPKLFDHLALARIAAQVIDDQLGNPPATLKAKPYEVPATQLKDKVDTKRSAAEALRRIEEGRL